MGDDPGTGGLAAAVSRSALPALLLAVPSEEILAASPSAVRLLSPHGRPVLGRSLEDFTLDETSGALPLLMAGRLNGYETPRVLDARGRPQPVTLWVRRTDRNEPPRHVLAVLATPGRESFGSLPGAADPMAAPVLGSTGPDLVIDRISTDVEALLGLPAGEALGRSLVNLVSPASAADLLFGLAQATTNGRGIPLRVELLRGDGSTVLVQLLVVPLDPPASCVFSILPYGAEGDLSEADVGDLLRRLASGIDALGTSRHIAALPKAQQTALSRLSAREADIVTRLYAGDRVPAIAAALFLAPGTVRNHLSSVFAKLGVTSQQQLIDFLRGRDEPPGEPWVLVQFERGR
jgi:DNA-binding CsgD family transcriptional regulator/PAS domain-containing protein